MSEPNGNDKKNPLDSVVDFAYNTDDHTGEFSPEDIQKTKGIAALSYIPILFFLPLVIVPDSKFARFHANQSLVLFIVTVVVGAVLSVIKTVFSLGLHLIAGIVSVISQLWGVLILVIIILGVVNACTGKAKELPVIGNIKIIR